MEHFVVSARKYRPVTFKDVVGQQAITNTLLNAIEHDHLAQALLFTGPRGVGKTTCARILAKMINQDDSHTADEDFAFNIFELDAASNNSVDDIRNLIDQVRIPPQVGKYKVYIIDEVHMLSTAAFNAFLKTLEEPPRHAIFILATTEKHKIIPTILSRCQIFDFKRITVTDAKNYLAYIAGEEGVNAEDDALHIIAQKADGAMRDALSIYDRVVSFSGKNLTRQAVTENLNVLDYETYLEVTDLILENNIPQLLVEFNEILSHGFDGHHFIAGLASHFRDLMVCKNPKTIHLLEVGDTTKTKYFEQSQKTDHRFLLQGIELANESDLKYKGSRNQRLMVELCLMQLASVTFDGEKKKSEQFIVPAENYKNAAPSPLKRSSEEKAIVKEQEYSTPGSAPDTEPPISVAKEKSEKFEKSHSSENSVIPEGNDFQQSSVSETIGELENIPKTAAESEDPTEEKKADAPPLSSEEIKNTEESLSDKNEQPSENTEEVKSSPDEPTSEVEKAENRVTSEASEETMDQEKPSTLQEEPSAEKISGLSMASIRKRKELLAKQQGFKPKVEEEKNEAFTEVQLQAAWDEYIHRLKNKGEKILASIMESDMPKIDGKIISIELPADTMKKDLEKGQNPMMAFLKKKLQNTNISLEIIVNEKVAKKYAFTNMEKYNKLKEKNPLIEKLRTTFDLEI
ncbi:DNA polymerase III subunit gamma/tau [Gillisia sp. Q332]|uniref:DNA polymerase III subunit gamma/tau n=1 Tax=Gillisia xinjiangensis TaxID=3384765 RepID=UPI0039192152